MEIFFFSISSISSLLILFYVYRIRSRAHNIVQSPQVSAVIDEGHQDSNIQDRGSQTTIFPLQTHKIKYCVYNKHFLKSYYMQKVYALITLENLWFNEPFYSTFFRIILLLDKDELFMVDPYSQVITSNLRDKNQAIIQVKSYQVLGIQQLVCSILQQVHDDVFKFIQKDAQNITMAICVYIIKKAKFFESWNQEHILELLLEGYKDVSSVKEILLLIDSKHEQLLFVDRAVKRAIKELYSVPYVDKGDGCKIQIPSKLPQKELLHI